MTTRSARRLVGAEVHKLLATRSGIAMLGAPVAYPAVVVALATTDGPDLRVDAIEALRGAGDVLPLIWLLVGALSVAREFGDGSIVATLVSVPGRSRLFGVKLAALAVTSVAVTAATVAVALGSVAVKEPDAWLDAVSAADLARTAAALVAVSVLFALIGAGVGEIVRHSTASAVGILLWVLVGENVLPAALDLDETARWVTTRAAASMVDVARPEPDAIGAAAGLGLLVAVAAATGIVAAVTFERRDVAG